jgi:hypothetical protein
MGASNPETINQRLFLVLNGFITEQVMEPTRKDIPSRDLSERVAHHLTQKIISNQFYQP